MATVPKYGEKLRKKEKKILYPISSFLFSHFISAAHDGRQKGPPWMEVPRCIQNSCDEHNQGPQKTKAPQSVGLSISFSNFNKN